VIGAAAALAAVAVIREFGAEFRDLGRPLAKATIKSGLSLIDRGRELAAHMGEVFEDLVIEARLELDDEHKAQAEHAIPADAEPSREVH
jgi:hypothetical protein